jgi:hypothetical protein
MARKKKESGSLGEMVRRGAERLARDPRAQRTAKRGLASCCNASVVDNVDDRSSTAGVGSGQDS